MGMGVYDDALMSCLVLQSLLLPLFPPKKREEKREESEKQRNRYLLPRLVLITSQFVFRKYK